MSFTQLGFCTQKWNIEIIGWPKGRDYFCDRALEEKTSQNLSKVYKFIFLESVKTRLCDNKEEESLFFLNF